MVKEYYSLTESFKIIFTDILNSYKFVPFDRTSRMNIPKKFGFILNILVFLAYLFMKIILSFVCGKDCNFIFSLSFWLGQLIYFFIFLFAIMFASYISRLIMKKPLENYYDWHYLISLSMVDICFLMTALSMLEKTNKIQSIFIFAVVIFSFSNVYFKLYFSFFIESEFFTDRDKIRYFFLLIFVPFYEIYGFTFLFSYLENLVVRGLVKLLKI
ncbi:hypothetical protein TUBRATIS_007820 [Tubulinosema ratisbonensis]|uniref:Uncharacterized protein n=1 Tax=Tubulinosema ratisbonensis TaxID=291195 RepID=A0A437ANE7_9MICR|nr:hypothetical protein TUBRATIS_007820 [Tubulinosema ratisbonensis]